MQVYDVCRAVKVCLGSKMLVGHKPSVPERFALHMKRTRLNLCLFGTWHNTCGKDKDEVGLNDTKVQPLLG